MSNVLVTGGAGFIGSHATEELVSAGHKVTVVDNLFLGTLDNLKGVHDQITFYNHDYTDYPFMEGIIGKHKIEYVFHYAGKSSAPMFDNKEPEGFETNIVGFAKLLRACCNCRVKRVFYATTSSIYGNITVQTEDAKVYPPNFYALTKYAMEHTARLFYEMNGLESIGFRFFSVYGKNEKHKGIYANLVSQFMWAIQDGKEVVIYGDGTQTRDFIYVRDLIDMMIRAMSLESKYCHGALYNLGTNVEFTVNDMVHVLEEELHKKARVKHVPNPIKNYVHKVKADLTKSKRELGFSPTYTLRDGIKDMLT